MAAYENGIQIRSDKELLFTVRVAAPAAVISRRPPLLWRRRARQFRWNSRAFCGGSRGFLAALHPSSAGVDGFQRPPQRYPILRRETHRIMILNFENFAFLACGRDGMKESWRLFDL